MKKYILSALCALALIACAKSDEDMGAVPATAPETIYATFEEPTTRTYVEQDKYLRWHAEDEISFFSTTYNLQYRFQGKTGDNNGSFTKITTDLVTGNALANNYAVYPYAASTAISDEGMISVTLPATQAYAENSFGRGANTMVAATNGTMDNVLRFKNAGGYLKLQLYGTDVTVKSITLQGNKGEKIAGEATITAVYGNDPVVSMADTATEVVKIDCGEGVTLSNDATIPTIFWFVLPETTFAEGFTVTVTDTEGGTFVKSTSNSFTIDRNMIQPMKSLGVECIPQTWKIYYTANKQVVPYRTNVFGANIVSNEFNGFNGKGIIIFDGEVQKVGNYAFYQCTGLTSITIPECTTEIGEYAFKGCSNLCSIQIPESVIAIGESAFERCSNLSSIAIPGGVSSISDHTFSSCTSLETVTLENGITSLGSYSFSDCYSLTSIRLPDSITSIGSRAFSTCRELVNITIGSNIKSIGSAAFNYCNKLSSIYLKATTPPSVGGQLYFPSNCNIYVPASEDDSVINAYKSASYWKSSADYMVEYEFTE